MEQCARKAFPERLAMLRLGVHWRLGIGLNKIGEWPRWLHALNAKPGEWRYLPSLLVLFCVT